MQSEHPQQGNSASAYHVPVLFDETMEALMIKPSGIYVDGTFGGGGHSRGILERLGPEGKLIAFDQDSDAAQNVPGDSRVVFVPQNFRHLHRFLRLHGIAKVDGILADLGVSSHQFDEGERGFSTRFEGPLDMRMDQRQQVTARHILQTYTEQQLHKMFEQYGEVTNAKTLARHIVAQRMHFPLNSINDLKVMISPVVKGNPHKYLAQVFQSLRIEVNEEMQSLRELLTQVPQCLQSGGRVAIITFHSIEDRIVKNYLKNGMAEEVDENPFDRGKPTKIMKVITRKPIIASEEEIRRNPRSRSAKLRVAEKI